jgi:hypothetical protein
MKTTIPEPKNEDGRSEYLELRDVQPAWHIHDGHMRLYIVGSSRQPSAWFPVTTPESSATRHGSEEERQIAKQAVEWLKIHQRDNTEAGPAEIRQALEHFGWKADEFTKYPV